MNIGKQIKYHRELQNLSMQELSRRAGIAQSGISTIESGNRQPTFEILEKIVSALNISWNDLLTEEPPNISPRLKELISNAEKLTADQLDAINNLIKTITKK